jgi:hypothetical protein
MADENLNTPTRTAGRRPSQREGALHLGPRKKAYVLILFISYKLFLTRVMEVVSLTHLFPMAAISGGRYMLYVMYKRWSQMAFSVWVSWQGSQRNHSLQSIFNILCLHSSSDHMPLSRQRREHRVFGTLLQMVPGLEERLMEGSEDDVVAIAEMASHPWLVWCWFTIVKVWQIQKGASSARSDDTKSLKGPILEWIIPSGQSLNPPLSRNVKMDRGFHHDRTGALLCPAGMDWSDPEYDHF